MQTVFRTNPFTGETRAYSEYTPGELDELRTAREAQLIISGQRSKPVMGAIQTDTFTPDHGHRKSRGAKIH